MDTQAIRDYLNEFHNPSIPLDQEGRINPGEFSTYKAELEKKRLGFILAVADTDNRKQKDVILEELGLAKDTVLKRGFVKVDSNQVLDAIVAGNKVFEPFYQIQVIDGILLESIDRAFAFFNGNTTSKSPSKDENTIKTETPLQKKLTDYPELLSVKDITEIFGVSDRTVTNWQRDGLLINVAEVSEEQNVLGHKKRGKEKRFKKEAVMHNLSLNEKYNATGH